MQTAMEWIRSNPVIPTHPLCGCDGESRCSQHGQPVTRGEMYPGEFAEAIALDRKVWSNDNPTKAEPFARKQSRSHPCSLCSNRPSQTP